MTLLLLYGVFNTRKYIKYLVTSALFDNSQYKMYYVMLLILI